MHLSSLSLRGFKSFLDRTLLKFGPGVTVVVGPNGSGKSNITDAFLWVMGEQSARTLRGSTMEDVIFHGSNKHKPVSFGEVSLTLDNSDGALPIEFSEVNIKRQITRDGQSSYFLNNAPCRLLDIHELLSDTGIGKDTYSIISQGRIDEILQAKPAERRFLIEEAANIYKHRRRRDRAFRRLEHMQTNIQRLADIIHEIERQLKPMRRRAKEAEEFVTYKVELRSLMLTNAYTSLEKLNERWNKLSTEETSLLQKIESDRVSFSSLEAEIEAIQVRVKDANIFKDPAFDDQRKIVRTLEQYSLITALLEEKERNIEASGYLAKNRLHELEARKKRHQSDFERISGDKQEKDGKLSDIYGRLTEARRITETIKKDLTLAAEKYEAMRNELKALSLHLDELSKRSGELNVSLVKEATRLNFAEEEYERFKDNNKDLQKNVDWVRENCRQAECALRVTAMLEAEKVVLSETELAKRRDELRTSVTAKNDEFEKLQKELEKLRSVFGSLSTGTADAEDRLRDLRQSDLTKSTEMKQLHLEIENMSDLEVRAKARATSLLEELKQIDGAIELYRSEMGSEDIVVERFCQLKEVVTGLSFRASALQAAAAERVKQLEVAFYEEQAVLRGKQGQLKTVHERNDHQQSKLRNIEVEKAQIEAGVEKHTDTLVNELNVSIEQASTQLVEIDPAECERRIEKLKKKMDSLGVINPIAFEELQELEERYEFIHGQFEDIRHSRVSLQKIIQAVDTRIEKRFLEVFETVSMNFQDIFHYVFPGGQAELVLVEDEDPLSAGIEIKAAPSGKRMKNIDLLSGGERSLVSLALLFAVYMTRPSPFYILDEVEAALDDINLQNFINLVNRFKGGTQFIIITHQRRTMEVADFLYGVSMQADGITKVISQDLSGQRVLAGAGVGHAAASDTSPSEPVISAPSVEDSN